MEGTTIMGKYESPADRDMRERSEYAARQTRMQNEEEERMQREEIERLEREEETGMRDLNMLKMNMISYVPLHQAHELAVRQNELYEAMKIVEHCGASPELTEAINRLGDRLRHIQADLQSACKQAIGEKQ